MDKNFAKTYKLLSILGTGGMSEVYLAQNIKTGTKVAIKILDHKLSKEEDYVERFKREVEISKTLSHPNIEKILSYGIYKGRYFIVYEYIEGQTLDKYIKSKKLPIKEIEDIILQILKGLSYAHSRNVIHRDIKPSNIMISKNGRVKILDFGIARATTKSTITKTGMFMGSPHYTSPEQIDGKKIDYRTDIYSLGIILYEMAEGKVPFEADTPLGFVRAHLDKPVPRIRRDVPDYFERLTYKCLAKQTSDRFSSAEEISNVIKSKSYAGETVIRPLKPKEPKKKKKTLSIGKIIGITIGSVAIVALIILIVLIYAPGEQLADEVVDIPSDFEPVKIINITATRLDILPNDSIKIFLKFEEFNSAIQTTWSCKDGSFINEKNNSVNWQAPNEIGDYVILATSRLYESSDNENIKIRVLEEEKDKVIVDSNNNSTSDNTQNQNNYNYEQDIAEESFLDKMYSLLDEYNLVANHIETFGASNITFGESNTIEFEGSVLVRYQELSNKLKNFSCPSSYENDKNSLIVIADAISFYQNEVVEINKNGSYEAYVNSFNAVQSKVSELFNYTNRMVDIHNKKFH